MSLGDRIHELRKRNNLSQERLAEKIGVARQTISKWELGETAPDIRQAQLLAQIFGVSLDELLGEDVKETAPDAQVIKTNNAAFPKAVAVIVAVIFLCAVIVGVLAIAERSQILYPQGRGQSVVISIKDTIHITNRAADTLVFNESGKPGIACRLPEGFASEPGVSGLYTDASGSFIMFNSDYEGNVVNPLLGTEYYLYYKDRGYDSYMDVARMAMYCDRPRPGIFASKEQLYLAGGAQIIRESFCAGQNADYYELGGELTADGEMRMYGFALHLDNTVWLVTLKDYEDNYYYISIKAPDGIGESAGTVGEFLSTVYAGNALKRSDAMDSVALQAAMNAYKEYVAIHLANGDFHYKYYVFQTDNSRFVAFADGKTAGVYYSAEEALESMLTDPDPDKLTATDVDSLWVYEAEK